jgi:hypothetical protein
MIHRPTLKVSMLFAAAALLLGTAQAATLSKAEYSAGKTRISDTYKTEKKACDAVSGNAKDVCIEEAKGREKVARAELEFSYTAKPADEIKTRVARAESTYAVAKEKCDDLAGNAKDVCVKEAKAVEVKALADAKLVKTVGTARTEAATDINDANYKVALEKCDAMAGDAKSACVAAAKSRFGKS